MTERNGKIIVVSGPSGVGKDTVIDRWTERNSEVRRVVAYTTRPPRPGEANGVDYHFVTLDRFDRMADGGQFLEYKKVHGNMYATPRLDMDIMLAAGQFAVLKIDVQGALAVMDRIPDALTVFILPPNLAELEARIRARQTDSDDEIERRLTTARHELSLASRYQYRLVNDRVDRVVDELERLVAGDA